MLQLTPRSLFVCWTPAEEPHVIKHPHLQKHKNKTQLRSFLAETLWFGLPAVVHTGSESRQENKEVVML